MAEGSNVSKLVEVGVLVPAILFATLPSLFELRQIAHDEATRSDLRIGEFVCGGMVLALGIAMSVDEHSIYPLVVVVVVAGLWFAIIEWAVRKTRNGTTSTSGAPTANVPPIKI